MIGKQIIYGVVTVLVSFTLIIGCEQGNLDNLVNKIEEHKTKVEVVIVKRGNLSTFLSLTGTLAPLQEVKITSKIPGRVEKVYVEEGDHVKAGDTLIQIEQEELILGVKQVEAALASATTHLDDTKNDYEKVKYLYEERSISAHKWEKIQAGLKVAESQVDQSKAALALARKQLANATIKSPIDGIITKKFVEQGEVVSPPVMPGKPLLQLMKLDVLKTKVNISEKRINQVHVGQKTRVMVDGLPDKIFSGEISRIAPVVDPQSRTFEVEINILNAGLELKAGMFARVKILLEMCSDVLLVPQEAIVNREEHTVIFVTENGIAQERMVTIGLNDGIHAEIISGVKKGEKVIVRGNVGIEKGTKVIVETAKNVKQMW
ncbi:MAG: efflux RND transporter periplasmic adaptor subunit [Thermodesulfobacteriota bacterium]|nr:efflux RND transporter periplasmic adaptor subunit [Thermodesulfobacteriota bacterium]